MTNPIAGLVNHMQNWDNYQGATAVCLFYGVDTPNRLQAILDWDTAGSTEYYIKRLYNHIWLTNTSMFPIYVQAYWVRARHDTDRNIDQHMEETPGSTTAPFASPCTSSAFRKYYKIIKTKNFIMKSGIPYNFKVKSIYAGGKPIQYNVEGAEDTTKRGNTTLVLKLQGIPLTAYDTESTDYVSALSSIVFAGAQRTYCSYYRMDDASDTSSISNNWPSTIPATYDYQSGNPTIMNWARQNTTIGTTSYSVPNTVNTN